ncbi:Excalibur calcium-binding domain-containing protein [Nocardioides scoriae]|uniref:Excalibur calcium-binding domain-containing protein n=1 Tax=Nocardioides scoriae TaxID=642780 RepID=A0A1H1VK14_9ACTN|nr:excalibur calcium-binding domain-containing protein [Nocardioides scoriae]SDS85227.1 Excalibur calcium-binding domain-containing protein [Nocardioides scoriae]
MSNVKSFGAAVATAVLTTTLGAAGAIGMAAPAQAHTTGIHDNCTKLNAKWKHGVGRANAVDKTSGEKVRNFYHNTKVYKTAVAHNSTLDRDKDGIACEKR